MLATGRRVADYIGQDGFSVRDDLGGLNLSDVPAVFLEAGNMRNPADAALLTDPGHQFAKNVLVDVTSNDPEAVFTALDLVRSGGRVVLASTGSEAVEIALKTAHLATGKPGVLAFDGMTTIRLLPVPAALVGADLEGVQVLSSSGWATNVRIVERPIGWRSAGQGHQRVGRHRVDPTYSTCVSTIDNMQGS